MADDLVKRALAEVSKASPPRDDLLRELAGELARLRSRRNEIDDEAFQYAEQIERMRTDHADALARKDAEIAAANAEIDELVRAVNLGSERAKKAERERDELRRRIAEADVAWIVGDDMFRSESEAIEEIRTWGPSDSIAHRVALVRLDDEAAETEGDA